MSSQRPIKPEDGDDENKEEDDDYDEDEDEDADYDEELDTAPEPPVQYNSDACTTYVYETAAPEAPVAVQPVIAPRVMTEPNDPRAWWITPLVDFPDANVVKILRLGVIRERMRIGTRPVSLEEQTAFAEQVYNQILRCEAAGACFSGQFRVSDTGRVAIGLVNNADLTGFNVGELQLKLKELETELRVLTDAIDDSTRYFAELEEADRSNEETRDRQAANGYTEAEIEREFETNDTRLERTIQYERLEMLELECTKLQSGMAVVRHLIQNRSTQRRRLEEHESQLNRMRITAPPVPIGRSVVAAHRREDRASETKRATVGITSSSASSARNSSAETKHGSRVNPFSHPKPENAVSSSSSATGKPGFQMTRAFSFDGGSASSASSSASMIRPISSDRPGASVITPAPLASPSVPIRSTVPRPASSAPVGSIVPRPASSAPVGSIVPRPASSAPVGSTVTRPASSAPIRSTVPRPASSAVQNPFGSALVSRNASVDVSLDGSQSQKKFKGLTEPLFVVDLAKTDTSGFEVSEICRETSKRKKPETVQDAKPKKEPPNISSKSVGAREVYEPEIDNSDDDEDERKSQSDPDNKRGIFEVFGPAMDSSDDDREEEKEEEPQKKPKAEESALVPVAAPTVNRVPTRRVAPSTSVQTPPTKDSLVPVQAPATANPNTVALQLASIVGSSANGQTSKVKPENRQTASVGSNAVHNLPLATPPTHPPPPSVTQLIEYYRTSSTFAELSGILMCDTNETKEHLLRLLVAADGNGDHAFELYMQETSSPGYSVSREVKAGPVSSSSSSSSGLYSQGIAFPKEEEDAFLGRRQEYRLKTEGVGSSSPAGKPLLPRIDPKPNGSVPGLHPLPRIDPKPNGSVPGLHPLPRIDPKPNGSVPGLPLIPVNPKPNGSVPGLPPTITTPAPDGTGKGKDKHRDPKKNGGTGNGKDKHRDPKKNGGAPGKPGAKHGKSKKPRDLTPAEVAALQNGEILPLYDHTHSRWTPQERQALQYGMGPPVNDHTRMLVNTTKPFIPPVASPQSSASGFPQGVTFLTPVRRKLPSNAPPVPSFQPEGAAVKAPAGKEAADQPLQFKPVSSALPPTLNVQFHNGVDVNPVESKSINPAQPVSDALVRSSSSAIVQPMPVAQELARIPLPDPGINPVQNAVATNQLGFMPQSVDSASVAVIVKDAQARMDRIKESANRTKGDGGQPNQRDKASVDQSKPTEETKESEEEEDDEDDGIVGEEAAEANAKEDDDADDEDEKVPIMIPTERDNLLGELAGVMQTSNSVSNMAWLFQFDIGFQQDLVIPPAVLQQMSEQFGVNPAGRLCLCEGPVFKKELITFTTTLTNGILFQEEYNPSVEFDPAGPVLVENTSTGEYEEYVATADPERKEFTGKLSSTRAPDISINGFFCVQWVKCVGRTSNLIVFGLRSFCVIVVCEIIDNAIQHYDVFYVGDRRTVTQINVVTKDHDSEEEPDTNVTVPSLRCADVSDVIAFEVREGETNKTVIVARYGNRASAFTYRPGSRSAQGRQKATLEPFEIKQVAQGHDIFDATSANSSALNSENSSHIVLVDDLLTIATIMTPRREMRLSRLTGRDGKVRPSRLFLTPHYFIGFDPTIPTEYARVCRCYFEGSPLPASYYAAVDDARKGEGFADSVLGKDLGLLKRQVPESSVRFTEQALGRYFHMSTAVRMVANELHIHRARLPAGETSDKSGILDHINKWMKGSEEAELETDKVAYLADYPEPKVLTKCDVRYGPETVLCANIKSLNVPYLGFGISGDGHYVCAFDDKNMLMLFEVQTSASNVSSSSARTEDTPQIKHRLVPIGCAKCVTQLDTKAAEKQSENALHAIRKAERQRLVEEGNLLARYKELKVVVDAELLKFTAALPYDLPDEEKQERLTRKTTELFAPILQECVTIEHKAFEAERNAFNAVTATSYVHVESVSVVFDHVVAFCGTRAFVYKIKPGAACNDAYLTEQIEERAARYIKKFPKSNKEDVARRFRIVASRYGNQFQYETGDFDDKGHQIKNTATMLAEFMDPLVASAVDSHEKWLMLYSETYEALELVKVVEFDRNVQTAIWPADDNGIVRFVFEGDKRSVALANLRRFVFPGDRMPWSDFIAPDKLLPITNRNPYGIDRLNPNPPRIRDARLNSKGANAATHSAVYEELSPDRVPVRTPGLSPAQRKKLEEKIQKMTDEEYKQYKKDEERKERIWLDEIERLGANPSKETLLQRQVTRHVDAMLSYYLEAIDTENPESPYFRGYRAEPCARLLRYVSSSNFETLRIIIEAAVKRYIQHAYPDIDQDRVDAEFEAAVTLTVVTDKGTSTADRHFSPVASLDRIVRNLGIDPAFSLKHALEQGIDDLFNWYSEWELMEEDDIAPDEPAESDYESPTASDFKKRGKNLFRALVKAADRVPVQPKEKEAKAGGQTENAAGNEDVQMTIADSTRPKKTPKEKKAKADDQTENAAGNEDVQMTTADPASRNNKQGDPSSKNSRQSEAKKGPSKSKPQKEQKSESSQSASSAPNGVAGAYEGTEQSTRILSADEIKRRKLDRKNAMARDAYQRRKMEKATAKPEAKENKNPMQSEASGAQSSVADLMKELANMRQENARLKEQQQTDSKSRLVGPTNNPVEDVVMKLVGNEKPEKHERPKRKIIPSANIEPVVDEEAESSEEDEEFVPEDGDEDDSAGSAEDVVMLEEQGDEEHDEEGDEEAESSEDY